ncbi:Polypyrimidine tract-binding protein 2 [Frankliniella fusca]|uniref:Polypyrimidine tract-binding protein 2 n=1 Tax=Frankliniella fusca TaxID=407009 RepID=A0AAE1HVP4_9NEOP|nr:Polypyrimidine tract-binding protein 2 [Frankliniella fusca]
MNGDTMVGIKRGPEEFRSGASNGSGPNSTDSDSKKMKLEGKPSRVIHVGNIPQDTTDAEVVLLGVPFGRVTNVLVLRSKNQAFLEMSDEAAASNLVQKYSQTQPQIRGRSVYTQFSNHRELKTETTSNALLNQGMQTQDVAGNGLKTEVTDNGGGVNTVLRVIIDNMICPVSLDVLHQVFSRCGKVLKIVTFSKNGTFQALIQLSSDREAQAAKVSLDGQNIYHNCCTLRIDFSKMSSLNVKFNNEKSRDFTNPSLPAGEGVDGMSSLNQGGLPGAAGLLGAPFVGLGGQLNGANGTALAGVGASLPLLGGFTLPANNTAATPVLLVTSLDEHIITPDHLFTLFGVYGHVLRVKILYSKKDCALVQMADPSQAQNALTHLDKIRVFGKQIHVMPSKYQSVQLPREGQPDAELTKDFAASPRHRFKQSLSKNYQNCHPPTQVLHLSNIPPSATEENLKEEFVKHGFEVKAFKFFPKDHKMALIQLPTVEDAVNALIKLHDFMLDGNNIRVSFSKSRI